MSELQQKSMKRWRKHGLVVTPVERRKKFPQKGARPCRACGQTRMVDIAVDLFNCFDLLAIEPGILGNRTTKSAANFMFIQVTDFSNRSKRRAKILASPEAKLCAMAGARILLETWQKKDGRWQVSDEWIEEKQFPESLPHTAFGLYEKKKQDKAPALPAGTALFQEMEQVEF